MIDATPGSARAENRRGRAAYITLWVMQVIGAVFMLGAAYPKFTGSPDMVELYRQIGIGQWFRGLTGVLESLGGIALLIPRLRAVGAVALCGLLIGAVITNFALSMPPAPTIAALIFMAVLAVGRRYELTPAWILGPHT